ncbi:hypothetical protein WN944_021189 [Citrus x changshan-huyou]
MGLNLDLNMAYVPKTTKVSKLHECIKRLEEERRKIDAFKSELPLIMLLAGNAIGKLEKQAMQCTEVEEEVEVVELAAFKGNNDEGGGVERGDADLSDRREWMSCFQARSSDVSLDNNKQQTAVSEPTLMKGKGDQCVYVNPIQMSSGEGAFMPLTEHSSFARTEGKEVSRVPSLSLMTPAMNLGFYNSMSNGRQPNLHSRLQNLQKRRRWLNRKKQRRSWSAELHQLFLQALSHLGGSEVATPKLIKKIMNVDGLTNDEIKSHLQKYRAHLRSPSNNSSSGQDNHPRIANVQVGNSSNSSILQCGSSKSQIHVPSSSANTISMSGGNRVVAEEDARSDGHSWNSAVSSTYAMNFAQTDLSGNQPINIKI